jgi:hypothetical protein
MKSLTKTAFGLATLAAMLTSTALAGTALAGSQAASGATRAASPAERAILWEVSCRGPRFCMAIGTLTVTGKPQSRLLEFWNGTTWQAAPDPLPGDFGLLTCGSPGFCFGEQARFRLVAWRGKSWQLITKNPADLFGVTCGSPTTCMTFDGNSIERWTGTKWQDLPGTDFCDGGPPGATCGWKSINCFTGTICLAFGSACQSTDCSAGPQNIGGSWNGREWSVGDGFPVPFYPGNLSCAGKAFCLNTSGPSQAEVNNGSGWQDVSPDLARICHNAPDCNLTGDLACGAPHHCVVVPAGSPLALIWSGSTWRTAPLARINGRLPKVTGLSCGSAASCMAVAWYFSGTSRLTIAEHWNGSAWQLSKTLNSRNG